MSCVLTLAIEDSAQQIFDEERRRYFPPALNRIPAHLTLFHTLPEDDTTMQVLRHASGDAAPFTFDVTGVRSLGRGVAFVIASPELMGLHRKLRAAFEDVLSLQDKQGFRPHIVAQNKVSAEVARDTLQRLQAQFSPWQAQAIGLDLWRYLGGPWQHIERFLFRTS